jgi:hypothetical protein
MNHSGGITSRSRSLGKGKGEGREWPRIIIRLKRETAKTEVSGEGVGIDKSEKSQRKE